MLPLKELIDSKENVYALTNRAIQKAEELVSLLGEETDGEKIVSRTLNEIFSKTSKTEDGTENRTSKKGDKSA